MLRRQSGDVGVARDPGVVQGHGQVAEDGGGVDLPSGGDQGVPVHRGERPGNSLDRPSDGCQVPDPGRRQRVRGPPLGQDDGGLLDAHALWEVYDRVGAVQMVVLPLDGIEAAGVLGADPVSVGHVQLVAVHVRDGEEVEATSNKIRY